MLELLYAKISKLAKNLYISEDMSYALLMKHNWDENEAALAYKRPDYVEQTFKFKINEGKDRLMETANEKFFTCGVCFFDDVELSDSI